MLGRRWVHVMHHPGLLLKEFHDFLPGWLDSVPDGRFSVLAGTSSTTAVACSILVLLVLTSRCGPMIAGSFGNLYMISTSFLYFQHVQRSNFCASRFFGALEHSHL